MANVTENRIPFAGIDGHAIEHPMEDAIREADRIRREHNGIGGVFLYLGHDGDNACEFRDFDGKTLAKTHSGRNLAEAVERCEAEWRRTRWLKDCPAFMQDAAYRFSGDLVNDGVFSTATFQSSIRGMDSVDVPADEIVAALAPRRDVVRLSGGSHWMILPGKYLRHE